MKRKRLKRSVLLLCTAAVALIWMFPFVYLVGTSFKAKSDFFTTPPTVFPRVPTFDNFAAIFSDPSTWLMVSNSAQVAVITTVLSVVMGTLCAFGLAKLGLPAWVMGAVVFVLLFIRFYPRIAMVIPFFISMRDLGLYDTPAAVILAHLGLTIPFVTWLMLIFFQGLPNELDEAAMIDGASIMQRFRLVLLPLVMPGIATSSVLTAVLTWNEFLLASTLTGSKAVMLSIGVASFITDRGIAYGPMAALSVLICAPIIVFALIMQRYLVEGMTLGAVKG